MKYDYQTLVVSEDKSCVAFIRALTEYYSDVKFFNSIRRAVSGWAKETEEGKKAFELSSKDFNIGDLSDYLDSKELKIRLEKEGITNLYISISSVMMGNDVWTYDTHLINIEKEE